MNCALSNFYFLHTLLLLGIITVPVTFAFPSTGKPELRSLTFSKWQLVNSEECGPVKIGSRITSGKAAFIGQYPWMARLGYERVNNGIRFKCGASLINQKYVVTAAHCIQGSEKKLKVVRLGEHFANTTKDCDGNICSLPVQDIGIDTLFLHPNYSGRTVKHDLGLIRLAGEAQYNEFVKPICLPRGEILKKSYVTKTVEVAGWGVVNSATEQESNTLLFVTLPVRDRCACRGMLPGTDIDDTQFCVGIETGQDTCGGDSGGPMMKMERVLDSKRYHLLGVVSVGKSYCGESPAIYTNVIKYMDWILQTIAMKEGQYESSPAVPEVPHN